MIKKIWTKEEIKEKLLSNQQWLERAIVALYERQTMEEQNVKHTRENNGVGFNKPDANKMTYYATWIKGGNHLSGKHLQSAQKSITKYAQQLANIANSN